MATLPQTFTDDGLIAFDDVLDIAPVGMSFTAGDDAITVATAGVYQVIYSAAADQQFWFELARNGAALERCRLISPDGSRQTGVVTLALNAGDTLGVMVFVVGEAIVSGAEISILKIDE